MKFAITPKTLPAGIYSGSFVNMFSGESNIDVVRYDESNTPAMTSIEPGKTFPRPFEICRSLILIHSDN